MEFTYDMARQMLAGIPPLHNAVAAFFNDHLGRAFPHAPAAVEEAGAYDPEVIRTAYSQGSMLIEVAADHLMGFSKTMTEPVEVFAPWVCVRAVLEASALASWFLEPGITTEERAKRSFAFKYEGMKQHIKFLQSWGHNASEMAKLNTWIEEMENTAVGWGMAKVQDKNGKRSGIGMQMPFITALVTLIFKDEPTYRLHSAMAHGHHWALQQLGYTVHGEDDGNSTYVKLKKHISAAVIGHLAARAVRAFVKPVWFRSYQNGWDTQRLGNLLESAYDAMLINAEVRFWRSTSSAGP